MVALVAVLAVVGGGCGKKVTPGLNVEIVAEGGRKAGERVNRVVARFDRAMVEAGRVGQDVGDAPLVIAPRPPGAMRWVDQRTLAFVPVQALPRSTRFEVKVPRGTQALDGKGLGEERKLGFETERLTIRTRLVRADRRPDPKRWATPDQRVTLTFNQPVATADVEEHCAFSGPVTVRARVMAPEAAAAAESGEGGGTAGAAAPATGTARATFTVAPADQLARASRWRFRCADRLHGAEGPLGLAARGADAGATEERELAFETFGPLKVVEVLPAGRDVVPDDVSLQVRFSTPIAREGGAPLPITIEPKVEGYPEHAWGHADLVTYDVRSLTPNTDYKIQVAAGVKDQFGQTLAGAHIAHFRTGNASPRLDVQTGSWAVEATRSTFPVWARNLTKIDVEIVAVPEAKLPDLLGALDWWDEKSVDLQPLGLTAARATVPVKAEVNKWTQVQIDPRALLPAAPAAGPDRNSGVPSLRSGPAGGLFYFALRAPEVPRKKPDDPVVVQEVLASFTNLGVTVKMASGGGLVWVTRLDDGAPQAGADVVIRDRRGKVKWRGRTGPDGVAITPGRAVLAPPPPPRPAGQEPEGEGEGEGDEGEGMGERSPGLLVVARLGNDVAFVDPERGGALEPWNFNIEPDPGRTAERLRGFLHTDRGLYRPGDTVHLRGLVRLMKLGEGLRVPRLGGGKKGGGGGGVAVTVRGPRGDTVLARTLPLSKYGGFSLEVPLSLDARLGDYVAEAVLPEGRFRERFSVEEYRAATFEAKVKPSAARFVAGESVRLAADARYFYGAPVRGGTLRWRVHSRRRAVRFDAFPDHQFDDERDRERLGYAADVEDLVTESEQTLDQQGRGALRLRLDGDDFGGQPRDLLVAAEVRDETNQAVVANLVVPVHRARVAFGIGAGGAGLVVPAKKSTPLSVIAVDPAGTRVAARATAIVKRRQWSCVWETWGFRGSYRCEQKETEVARRDLDISAEAPATAPFEPPAAGEYWFIVEGKDARGKPTTTSRSFWVYGQGESPWRVDDSSRFEILADKPRYQPGETARLLVKAPTAGATALLTIEREGVLERRLLALPPEGEALEVPLRDSHGPNVYVSLLLARGRTGKGARGLPALRMGMVTLPVDVEHRRLAVQVTTDRPDYRPGAPVTAEVLVRDAEGRPVQAEVALAAADEGVLSLIAFKTPDPMATFYAPWGLGVKTATQYERLARLPEPDQERYATGGDGAGRLGTMRSRFLATAYFNPRLETDAAGRARVTFPAPDNLTAFRLMAVAADKGDRFGSGDRRFQVRKPLQLVGALPRFLSVGDEIKGGVVVMNETGRAGPATVEARVTGASFAGGAAAPTETVELAVGGRAAVGFPLRASKVGEVRFRFGARMPAAGTGEAEEDGLELRVPVTYPTRAETTLVARGETSGAVDLPLKLPAGVLPGTAALEVSVDPDGLAGLEESLRALIEYPYGCLEQTTSRLVPLVAVQELSQSLGLPELEGPRLQRYIRVAIEKIGGFQTESGGFGLWRGSPPETYLTAFALWGLKLAADAGHPVDRKRLDEGVAYLRRALAGATPAAGEGGGVHNELGELGSRAFVLHVLGLFGKPDPGYATKLLEKKDRLPRFGLAFLAQAMARDLGPGHARVKGILDELLGAADRGPQAVFAVIRERSGTDLQWYMSSDTRTSAIATDAFLYLRPADPEIPKLVRGLLEQQRDGRWPTTQDNLYALVALSHYARSRPAQDTAARVSVGSAVLVDGPLAAQGPARIRHARFALAVGGGNAALPPLRVAASKGTVHYQARLKFRRDREHQPALSEGFELSRAYLDPATGKVVDRVAAGAMVRVRLTIASGEERSRVAVSDPLPAGLEPLNTRFATTAAVAPGARPRPGREDDDGDRAAWITHKELRDDRVDVFYDHLPAGSYSFEYFARATTAGTYVAPAATVEQMYRPEVRARTALGTFTVTAK